MAVVGAPSYFIAHPKPRTPQDLAQHRCINFRPADGGRPLCMGAEKGGRALRVRVDGQLAFNNPTMVVRAAIAGFGLACVLEDHVEAAIGDGGLVRVLEAWCPPFAGYHLYYPSRRQPSAAFALLVEALRYRG